MRVSVGEKLSNIKDIVEELKSSSSNVGAVVVFVGVVRRESRGRHVYKLLYESHRDLAEQFLWEIAKNIKNKYNLLDIVIEHRIGELEVGEETMIVGVAAKHREEAFLALGETIERIKRGVPIWKKEIAEEGEFWIKDESPPRIQVWVDGKKVEIGDEEGFLKGIISILEKHIKIIPERAKIKISITTENA